jgi:hypothetical protein
MLNRMPVPLALLAVVAAETGQWAVPCPQHKLGSCATPSGVSTRISFDPPLQSDTPNVSLSFAKCTDARGQWITGPCPCCGDHFTLHTSAVSSMGATIKMKRDPPLSFGSSFVVAWEAPAPPPPPPLPPAALHLSIMTMYGYNQSLECGWMNVIWQELGDHNAQHFKTNLSVALSELASYARDCNASGFVMLPTTFFAQPKALPPDWQSQLTTFEETVKPFVDNGTAIGIFMGDEKLCGGVSLKDYSAVLAHLRAAFGARVLLYGNECSNTITKLGGGIPVDLDLFSFDLYDAANTDGLGEYTRVKQLAEQVIFPALGAHQRLLLVPGIYGNTPASCVKAGGGAACALELQEKQIVAKLDKYLEWARSDLRIVGFNPWHMLHRGPQNGAAHDMAIGAEEMPTVLAKLREIGAFITTRGLPPSGLRHTLHPATASDSVAFVCTFGGGSLSVDLTTGSYTVGLRATSLPAGLLKGAPPGVLHGGRWLSSTAGGGLSLASYKQLSGSDGNGAYTGVSLAWQRSTTAADNVAHPWRWVTSFKCYANGPLFFRQAFPAGSVDTPGGVRSQDQPSTAFPSFPISTWPQSLRLATFFGQNAARTTQLGNFTTAYSGGYEAGPLAIFPPELDGVVVLSSLTNFMVTEHNIDRNSSELRFGLQGLLHTVPAGFAVDFVLSVSGPSAAPSVEHAGLVAAGFVRWGNALLRHHGGVRTAPDASKWTTICGIRAPRSCFWAPRK